jgi:hypothetical protein
VLSNPLRTTLLAGALSLIALAGSPIASASAAETSQITSPAGPTYALYDETAPSSITVSGTTTISGNIALRCYYGSKPENNTLVANEVKPSGGTFSVEVETKSLYDGPCVLRAVPVADKEAHPPGIASEEAEDHFQGPRIVGSSFEIFTESKVPYDYEVVSNTLSGYFDIESVGDCGLDYSRLFAPTSLIASDHLFDCNAALYKEDDPSSGSSTRSELQIDGANAYGPATAHYLESNLKVAIPGAPDVAVTKTFDPSSGLVTIHEVDPIVECSPSTAFPPTSASCTSFVSAGVQLERTWQTSNANQVAWMTDTWRSTDGAAHSLNALYDQELVNDSETGGAYEFPGDSTFSPATKEQVVTLPSGAGAIYYKEDAATSSGGDGIHPQGAIVYDTRPNGPLSVYRSTEAKEGFNGFEMPYLGTIPAGGTYTLRMAFVQAFALSEVEALAGEVLASYHPTLAIGSPANGTTVSTPSVTVSGTASDSEGTPTLAVDGHAVSVGSGGAWSTSVPLSEGANTIKALATNQLGLSTEKTVSVTYTPPSPPVAHASQVGSAKGANGEATLTIACTGSAGTSCELESTLTTVERTRNGKPVAVSARRHRARTHSQQVTVGSSKLTIPAGQRVTIPIQLNSIGKSLLARFGQLPVHLTAVLIAAGHRSTVIAQNLVLRPHHRSRHRGHHHHHR